MRRGGRVPCVRSPVGTACDLSAPGAAPSMPPRDPFLCLILGQGYVTTFVAAGKAVFNAE